MSDPKQYTVGWICAIKTERVAAEAFLDERHDGPEHVSTNDNNDYSLGLMGRHKVAIAVLPDGEYGISSAASVARDMLHTFPNIRIGLMVGIGGGAPSPKHDIRLGDVVVSASREGKGSVLQYDFGKTVQSQTFQMTSFLNQSPSVFRTAVSGLSAQYDAEGNKIEEMINHVLKTKPRLQRGYGKPDPSTDRLYRDHVIHEAGTDDCSVGCSQDPSHFIHRQPRTEYDDNPAVHYGRIASANQLMKDALIRTKLATENNVLCFEMEAAGLMNHFPCLVVRGICDYADTHKSKEWQGYAAMAAAAYSKDLLSRMPPNKVEAEKRIASLVSDAIELMYNVQHDVEIMKTIAYDHEELEILQWLTTTDYGPQHNDNLNRREPGTGQDLLQSNLYQYWIANPDHTILCPGIPGSGKTMQTTIVIDHLFQTFHSDRDVGLAYIYFDFRKRVDQSLGNLLASLLKQFSKGMPLSDQLRRLYQKHSRHDMRPSEEELLTTTKEISILYSRTFVVIDALDECPESDGLRSKFLEKLRCLQAATKANIFLTSRFLPEAIKGFRNVKVSEVRASESDVGKYLNSQLTRLPSFVNRSPELKDQVKRAILVAVKGMWLLAQLHLDSLVGKRSIKAMKHALRNLPSGERAYDVAYDNAMERINGQVVGQSELANQALLWITCAKVALNAPQLRHALAVEIGTSSFDPENLSEVEDIVAACAGLVTFDKESNIVRLVHYTTQDYLERTKTRWFPNAQGDLTKACVTYLSFRHFEMPLLDSRHKLDERHRLYPFYKYAAYYWGAHARETRAMIDEIATFLQSDRAVKSAGQVMCMRLHPWQGWSMMTMTGLHFTALSGALEVSKWLLTRQNVDALDTQKITPLVRAAQGGHEDVARLLLNHGANVNPPGSTTTPLLEALRNGNPSTVKLLVKYGASVNPPISSTTPLLEAVRNGDPGIVELLVRCDANVNPFGFATTPLREAVRKGDIGMVEFLVKNGANVNPSTTTSLLSSSIEMGHLTIAKILTKHGAETNPTFHDPPLLIAIYKKAPALAECLIQHGANPSPKSRNSPLIEALRNGYSALAELLIQRGADPNPPYVHTTPLFQAIRCGASNLVELLIKNGADVNPKLPISLLSEALAKKDPATALVLIQNGARVHVDLNKSLLFQAIKNGYLDLAHALVLRGADVNFHQPGSSASVLSEAINKGYVGLVGTLIELGADLGHFVQNNRSILRAAFRENSAMAKLLIRHMLQQSAKQLDRYGLDHSILDREALLGEVCKDNGPEVTALGYAIKQHDVFSLPHTSHKNGAIYSEGESLLHAALFSDKLTIQELLENGVDINSRLGSVNETPLVMASGRMGSEIAVRSLIEYGAEVEPSNRERDEISPLIATIIYNNVDCARVLLDNGAEANPTDQVPLHLAVICAEDEMTKLLLEKGANVNLRDSNQRTALSLVCRLFADYPPLISDPVPWSSSGTPVIQASTLRTILQLLLSNGADIEAKDIDGQSPLFVACVSGSTWAIDLLLDSGADLHSENKDRETPLFAAGRKGKYGILVLLKGYYDNCQTQNKKIMFWTSLMGRKN